MNVDQMWRSAAADSDEDAMTLKFSAAMKSAALLAAVSIVAIGFGAGNATAQTRREQPAQTDRDGRPVYGPNGPNRSYQQGPRTRVYITTRSWLDAGVEVLPGDRKFNDYAFPPTTSFGMQNNNRPLDRQPLSPPSDLGGYPRNFPLY
jgi:hypothetical protein